MLKEIRCEPGVYFDIEMYAKRIYEMISNHKFYIFPN